MGQGKNNKKNRQKNWQLIREPYMDPDAEEFDYLGGVGQEYGMKKVRGETSQQDQGIIFLFNILLEFLLIERSFGSEKGFLG
jgi:hypothetical protein